MNKKVLSIFLGVMILLIGSLTVHHVLFSKKESTQEEDTKKLSAIVLASGDNTITLQDKYHIIYTFPVQDFKVSNGSRIFLEYTGILDKNKELQDVKIVGYDTSMVDLEKNGLSDDWDDQGIFQNYYTLAYQKVQKMSLKEKIAQIFLVRYPDKNQKQILEQYQFGGYIFFAKDFKNLNQQEVIQMMNSLQEVAKIPILTAVDEEGGSVVRVSSNSKLASQPFESPSSLYQKGGFPLIQSDTVQKSKLLNQLGINLNLAPVVDVSTSPSDYMYNRALGENTELTSTYAKTVINASKGLGVSYTLKHFPGYGNNVDTHTGSSMDNRSLEDIQKNDLPPFQAGIDAGAEAVLVSHNTVTNIDASHPASLSPSIHNLLRNQLHFTGIIITDDLSMGAVSSIDQAIIQAILAGNDLIITTNYQADFNFVLNAVQNSTISESMIDKLAMRVIAWKYYKGLLLENQK